MCKPCRHADAFCCFDLRDVDAFEIPFVWYCIRMLFIYLNLRDIWRPLLSPLRLPVPPSRLYLQVPDFTTSLWLSSLFIENDECATV